MKRFFAVILAALMVIVSVGIMPESVSAAVDAPAMAKKTVSIKTGKRATVRLKTASIKKGWTISSATAVNKRIASVGSDTSRITITGKKAGNTSVKVIAVNGAISKKLSVRVKVSKARIPVESVNIENSVEIKVGESRYLTATVYPSNATNKKLQWYSKNTNIASVDEFGQIKGISVGTAQIIATSNNGNEDSCYVTVKPADVVATDIRLNISNKEILEGESFTLTTILTPSNASPAITWTSDRTDIAYVDATGKVTGAKAGTAIITAKISNGKTATCRVTVKAKVDATGIKIEYNGIELKSGETIEVAAGASATLTANMSPVNSTSTVTWKTTDTTKTYSTLDKTTGEKITVTCKNETPTNRYITITATTSNGRSVSCKLVIKKRVDATKIELNSDSFEIKEKATMQLTATLTPKDATSAVTWKSLDSKVASVSSTGLVTGIKAGTTTITATANGYTAKCEVTVKAPEIVATGITLSETAKTIKVGDTFKLTATLSPAGASATVTWSSSNEAVATVDKDGNVTGKSAGPAIIKAIANGKEALCALSVEAKATEPTDIKATGITLSSSIGGSAAKNKDYIELNATTGEYFSIWASVEPKDTTSSIEWVIDNSELVEKEDINAKTLKITCKTAGVVIVKAKIDGFEAICRITITDPTT